jgi:hypothetical protein
MSGALKYFGYIAVFAILSFAVWMLWVFVTNINAADASVKAGLIGLFGVFSAALITNYQTKKREIDARHFADKREGYMHMIDLLFDLILSVKKGEEMAKKEMVSKMMSFKKALIVWGSAEIIDIWNQYEIKSDENLKPEQMIVEMEKILRAIRKDLGHDDSRLKFGNLWGLMLVAKDKKILLDGQQEKSNS